MPDWDRPEDLPSPLGMVDHLDSAGFGPGEEELAFARAYVADGEMDPAVLAMLSDPERGARNERRKAWRMQRDWPALSQYRDDNLARAGSPIDVVFMGDSLTEMWRIANPGLFGCGYVNRGISGQTTPQMLLRFMAEVVALKPRICHLMAGTNDVAGNTGPNTAQDFRNNILAMLDLAQAHGITVVLASLPPFATLAWSLGLTLLGIPAGMALRRIGRDGYVSAMLAGAIGGFIALLIVLVVLSGFPGPAVLFAYPALMLIPGAAAGLIVRRIAYQSK